MAINVDWTKCGQGESWCDFRFVSLTAVRSGEGVYIVWNEDQNGRRYTVYVGQGEIRDRIAAHRQDPRFDSVQSAFVTWVYIANEETRLGVERYLGNVLRPSIGKVWPAVTPIQVNLPW